MKNKRIAPKLYQLARKVNTVETFLSGDPEKMLRRLKNILVGRLGARAGVWNKLWR